MEGGGRDDVRLVEGLRGDEPWARAALVDRYGVFVRRVLVRVLGAADPELEDLAQDAMIAVLQGIGKLGHAEAFRGWLTSIVVFTARGAIRRRQRWRWLKSGSDPAEAPAPSASPEVQDAAACVYRILEDMPADERIPFTLRMFEGYELTELAGICGLSVATLRRRLAAAQKRFDKKAQDAEALKPWLNGSSDGNFSREEP